MNPGSYKAMVVPHHAFCIRCVHCFVMLMLFQPYSPICLWSKRQERSDLHACVDLQTYKTLICVHCLRQNLLRGRGLFCQSIMKSQVASPTYTPVFAALVAVIGSKIPAIPELLVHRLIAQYRRSFKRNDRALCTAVVKFFVHLANQRVRLTPSIIRQAWVVGTYALPKRFAAAVTVLHARLYRTWRTENAHVNFG